MEVDERLRSCSVLIVDDSRTQLFAMAKMLKSVGIATHTAENGKQGILMARHVKPDLILMDIVMPELNGFQATRHLVRQPDTCHIPIIIVSGSNQESDKAWGLKLGARDYIAKPVNKAELITKVHFWLNSDSALAGKSVDNLNMLNTVQAI
ncbi:MAG: response regulator [Gammaproteobacteria bacterium]|nr:response regulator [Gammaproteobacteria bacterium]